MIQTTAATADRSVVETPSQTLLLDAGSSQGTQQTSEDTKVDYLRISLTSFLKEYGTLSDQDFALFAAYFDEKKNGTRAFSSENIRQYYQDGRRTPYSNNGVLLRQLVKKGYIMDTPTPEGAKPGKYYMLTDTGLEYIKGYTPKESNDEKKKSHRTKKTTSVVSEAYKSITADDLNLKNYPAVKSLSGTKEQVIMAMYIVVNEEKGEWFTVDDVIYILVNIFEVPANSDKINGVFKRNKSMFISEKNPDNKKTLKRKLLSGAKDFATEIIQRNTPK